jgi:thiamine pyrophosphokinase
MSKRALIISGGSVQKDFLWKVFRSFRADFVIAADSGLEAVQELEESGALADGSESDNESACGKDVMVTYIVGDFDSAKAGILKPYENRPDVEIRRFKPEKDYTDTEIALRLALELGSQEIVLMGCTGTRLDHVWGNVQLLVIAREAGAKAWILDTHNRISLAESGMRLKKCEQFGKYVSLFPLGGAVKKLTLRGMKYPLTDYELRPISSRCVSNEIEEDEAVITFEDGLLLVMETRD